MAYAPSVGIVVFVVLYVFAATLYPGGSQADINHIGFDWVHNYWCNLTNELAINGVPNPARPYAMVAMMILCCSLTIFFIQFARQFAQQRFWQLTIQISGVISMLFTVLIFTKYHNIMIGLSSIFGLFVLIGIIVELYKSNWLLFKWAGLISIFLLGLNNYIYYSDCGIEYLPLLQKLTFAYILLLVVGLNCKLAKQ